MDHQAAFTDPDQHCGGARVGLLHLDAEILNEFLQVARVSLAARHEVPVHDMPKTL